MPLAMFAPGRMSACSVPLGGFDAGGECEPPQLQLGRVLDIRALSEVIDRMMQVDPAMRQMARVLLQMSYCTRFVSARWSRCRRPARP